MAILPMSDEHHHSGRLFGERAELIFSLTCGAALLIGVIFLKEFVPIFVVAYFFGGFFAVLDSWESLRKGKFDIDFLMIVAALGAAALGEWSEGALLLFLFSLGNSLEHYAMGRARRAIEALADLAPDSALVRLDGNLVELPVEELKIGYIVVIKPDERVPADGFVIKGTSSVDQAPITGESVPVDKRPIESDKSSATTAPEHCLFAGSINQSGALEMEVTKLSGDTTLARVVTMVNEAEKQRSPTQQFATKFERIFVPLVLGFVGILLLACLVIDEPFSVSFYRAMAVLVGASPCALAISTPSAVLSGIARAARGGVLIKGGAPLENLGKLGAIAFDKTGTLTVGKPRLTDVIPANGMNEADLLEVAIAVEKVSEHPIASAIVRDGEERLGKETNAIATGVTSITGRGLKGMLDGVPVYIGKEDPTLPEDLNLKLEELKSNGRTTMVVRRGEDYLGLLGVMDTPRPGAKEMIARLRELGIHRMIMISGDNQKVATAVAKVVGLDEARGDLMPEDKVKAIGDLRLEEEVAMVGDGVNDAPAMAYATVGIAMGAAGSDVALETADVALMGDKLSLLPFAVGLSRKTNRIIRQNVWISLGMVAILVPASLFGLSLGIAVLFHEGSTVAVVLNALRLLAYRSDTD
jgi:Cd2+/Zn2+-exporting ATPase